MHVFRGGGGGWTPPRFVRGGVSCECLMRRRGGQNVDFILLIPFFLTWDILSSISPNWVVMFLYFHRMVFTFLSWLDLLGAALAFRISILTRHVFVKHGCPRRQQNQNMAKISKSYILTLPPTQPPGACDVSEVWGTNRWLYSPSLVTV